MPRKRWQARLSFYDIPVIDPKDRNAVEDHHLVRSVLVDFDELAVLSSESREQLVANLVRAICFARAGIKAGKRGVSDKVLTQQIIMSDIGRALEWAGLPPKRWRKQYDNGGGESFYFRLAREIARLAGIDLPMDLKLLAKRAAGYRCG